MISRSQRILGLDIGSSSVKGVELARTGDRFTVTGFAEQEIASAGTLKDAIAAVIREGRFKSKQVISSVSGRSVIVRYVNTPFMKHEELKNSMRFEADKYIPFDVNEVILDCVPLDDKPAKETGDMRVVLVAVKKEVVNEHVRILQEVGLFPYIIDVDCFALGNAFEMASESGDTTLRTGAPAEGDVKPEIAPSDTLVDAPVEALGTDGAAADTVVHPPVKVDAATGEKAYALIDIGAQKTNINIMHGNRSAFTREVYIGGEDMTEAVAKLLGVTPGRGRKGQAHRRKGRGGPRGYFAHARRPRQRDIPLVRLLREPVRLADKDRLSLRRRRPPQGAPGRLRTDAVPRCPHVEPHRGL